MILIQEILVSDELIKEQFACALDKCQGACCEEGDYGAPLEEQEVDIIKGLLSEILPFLDEKSKKVISEEGYHVYNEETDNIETTLVDGGPCVFMGREKSGISYCAIEKAYYAGKIDYKKPISCHLYPIRVSKNETIGFEALNYDRWDICSAACTKGKKEGIRIYEFAKEAIIRKYGVDFYQELDAAAKNLSSE